jgi:PAS domain S-box-containing protein
MAVDEYPVSRVLATKFPVYNLVVGIKKSEKAEPIWVLDTAIPEFDENNDISQIITTFMDISVHKKSEDKYHNLFVNIMHEVHLWKLVRDEQGLIKTWVLEDANPAALKAWGRTRSEIIGKTTDEIFSYEATQQFMPIVEKIFSEHSSYTWEEYFSPTGQYLYMTSVSFGEYFISTGIDISERKSTENALKENYDRFVNMFEYHDAIMLLIEPETGSIINANKSTSEFYGYSKQELCSMNISQINILSAEQIKIERENALSNNRNYFIFSHKLANDEIRTVEVHSSPIKYQNKLILFSIIHDITERKQLEQEKDHLIDELKQALAKVKKLEGLLPICSYCKNIRDDKGYWQKIEKYIHERSDTQFSHSICPDCAKKYFPDLDINDD